MHWIEIPAIVEEKPNNFNIFIRSLKEDITSKTEEEALEILAKKISAGTGTDFDVRSLWIEKSSDGRISLASDNIPPIISYYCQFHPFPKDDGNDKRKERLAAQTHLKSTK